MLFWCFTIGRLWLVARTDRVFQAKSYPRRVLQLLLSKASETKSQASASAQNKQCPSIASIAGPVAARATTAAASPTLSQTTVTSPPEHKTRSHRSKSGESEFTKALSIIAEESGIDMAELTDSSTKFADVGVDSLLGLSISARFQEELNLSSSINFDALFFDYPSVGDLKTLLGVSDGSIEDSNDRRRWSTLSDMSTSSPAMSTTSAIPSRASVSSVSTVSEDFEPKEASLSTGYQKAEPGVDFSRVMAIILEESGIAAEDMADDTNFADCGLDSLLSLVIVARFRDELGLDLQNESLFLDCPTVVDLKVYLHVAQDDRCLPKIMEASEHASTTAPPAIELQREKSTSTLPRKLSESSSLTLRKQAIDDLVRKYTAGFRSSDCSWPTFSSKPINNGKVVLITGASGSLGCHLVQHIAQLPGVSKVVCLNRLNGTDPWARQTKSMEKKGIHLSERIRSKLLVLQTDTTKSLNLGLSRNDYEELVYSTTHLIHNGWPMTVKRPLSHFEPQLQIMRNLIDFAADVVSSRPKPFQFTFQLISSISVVGGYNIKIDEQTLVVPEDRVDIDAVLPIGYSEAKWACERMLDETLHRCPERFRAMVVRPGQIAGSSSGGYWNANEHFAFMMKSSVAVDALPDIQGDLRWTPVNDVAGTVSDLAMCCHASDPVYHIDNPVGQPWGDMNAVLADALNISDLIPFQEWLERVRAPRETNNPASTLVEFLDDNYIRMSCGSLRLGVRNTLGHSTTLARVGPVTAEVARRYIQSWKDNGFLNAGN